MDILSHSKDSFSVGTFPVAFSIITFILQLAQGLLPASSPPRLTVARKTSSLVPPPTPTSRIPTPTLSFDYPDVSASVRPLLVGLILVVLGVLVASGTTYIRRKSGTIFTPLARPSKKEQDPPQPPTPPSPDDYSADDEGQGDENEDGDDDGDSSSEDDEDSPEDDVSEDGSDNDPEDPEDPEDPSGGSNVEKPLLPSSVSNSLEVLLLAILYVAGIIILTGRFSAIPMKRIINSLARHLNKVSTKLTLNVRKVIDCLLIWLDQGLLQLYNELLWINDERPPHPAFNIGMKNFGFNGTSITLHATDELHELKHALLDKIETISRAPSTWASQVCPLFRGSDNMPTTRFNDTMKSNPTLKSTQPLPDLLKSDTIVPKPTATSSIHSILSAAIVYGVIGALIQMLRNGHARRARIQQDFGEEGTTLFEENAGSTMMDILGDDETEDHEEEVTNFNLLQGPDSVTASESNSQENNEQEGIQYDNGNDNLHTPEVEVLFDGSESAMAYTTALSISSTFASAEVRTHETTNSSTTSTPNPTLSTLPPHETGSEERAHEGERFSDPNPSITTDTITHSINDACASVAVPETRETANINNFDLPFTLLPPNGYCDNEPENIEEEDDRERGHYIQEADWYEEEEVYGDEYPGFYQDAECENSGATSSGEHENSEEQLGGRYVQEEEMYEEENLYGDDYPGFYDDEDIEEEDSKEKSDVAKDDEPPSNQKPEEYLGEMEMDIEKSDPSICCVGIPETSPKDLRFIDHNNRIQAQTIIMQSVAALEMTRSRFVEGEALTIPPGARARSKARRRTGVSMLPEDQEALILQMMDVERVREQFIEEEEARLKAAGGPAHFPDAEPIAGSDISIYFRRRPSSKFHYTEEGSSEGQSTAPALLVGITEKKLVQTRKLVERAYSSHDYDPSQIDALTRWHLYLKDEEGSC